MGKGPKPLCVSVQAAAGQGPPVCPAAVLQEQSRDVPTTGSPRGEATCTSDGQSSPGFLLTTHLQLACRSTQLHPDTDLTLAGGMVPFPARREDLNPPTVVGTRG